MIVASFILGITLAFFFVFLGASNPGELPVKGEEVLMGLLRRAEAGRICYRCNVY